MGVRELTSKKISGDGLSLSLRCNEQYLQVTGDGCDITMSKNRGSIKIIGDGCRLRIELNTGDVEYTGDGGQILLGPKSVRDRVKYIGDGGRISVDGDSRTKSRKSKEPSREQTGKGLDAMKDAERDWNCSKSKEEAENESNRRKEAENESSRRKETKRSGARREEEKMGGLVGARIITSIQYGEKIVKRTLVNPQGRVRTLDGVSFVEIVPKQTKTKIEVK
ncbi:uncharacterized protein LOC143429065 [Xylocopa sonorina]|uniref:uncharacterized protein LOC143429065 n=1 Tax=Xylocopa sonorina TaxID=1818115 RepID=UPI00403A8AC4